MATLSIRPFVLTDQPAVESLWAEAFPTNRRTTCSVR